MRLVCAVAAVMLASSPAMKPQVTTGAVKIRPQRGILFVSDPRERLSRGLWELGQENVRNSPFQFVVRFQCL